MIEIINNKPEFKERRSQLRRDQTDAERKLWHFFRNRQFFGLKFYRQFSVGPYILDFYCFDKKLAIELDGSQHLEKEIMVKDRERTEFLNTEGITVIRFMNNDVLVNTEDVFKRIANEIEGQVNN